MLKRTVTLVVVCTMIIASMLIGACVDDKDGLTQGKYYLATGDGESKSSYVNIIDDATLELVNIDATEYANSVIEAAKSLNDGALTIKNPKTGEDEELVVKDATEQELATFANTLNQHWQGEHKYKVTISGNVHEIFLDNDDVSIGEYFPESKTIKVLSKSYKRN